MVPMFPKLVVEDSDSIFGETKLTRALERMELQEFQKKIEQVTEVRDDCQTICTTDAIECAANCENQNYRADLKKQLEWEEQLRQIKRVCYASHHIDRLVPHYAAANKVSSYTALLHIRTLFLPLSVASEVQRCLQTRRCIKMYFAVVSELGIAVIKRIPLTLVFDQRVRACFALKRSNFCRTDGRAGLTMMLDLRVPIPVNVDNTRGDRIGNFLVTFELVLNAHRLCANVASLQGRIVRAGMPLQSCCLTISKRNDPTDDPNSSRSVQRIVMRKTDGENGFVDVIVTEIVHRCLLRQKTHKILNSNRPDTQTIAFKVADMSHSDQNENQNQSMQLRLCPKLLDALFPKNVNSVAVNLMKEA